MNTKSGKRRIQLVLSDSIYNRLQELAETSGRTMPGYLRWLVNRHLEEQNARAAIQG